MSSGSGAVIPALHDAASDRPIRYTPVCGHATGVPVCLNPAYRRLLPDVTAALRPRRAAGCTAYLTPKALAPLLGYLRGLGVAPQAESAASATQAEVLLEEYRRFLLAGRGVQAKVARGYLDLVRPFVAGHGAAGAAGLGRLPRTQRSVARAQSLPAEGSDSDDSDVGVASYPAYVARVAGDDANLAGWR